MRVEKDVMLPLADGVHLATDLYLPDEASEGPWPVILVRTPYDKNRAFMNFELMTSDGFAIAIQDVRGRFQSEGDFFPLENERYDGIEVIDWLREQDWCNGDIGTASGSYVGATQWLPALSNPEGLKVAMPQITGSVFDGFCFYGRGIPQMDILVLWNSSHIDEENRRRGISISDEHAELKALRKVGSQLLPVLMDLMSADPASEEGKQAIQNYAEVSAQMEAQSRAYLALPLYEQIAQLEPYAPWIRRFLDNMEDPDSDFWDGLDWPRHYDDIKIPMFHHVCWHDLFVRGGIRDFEGLTARANGSFQKIVIGTEYHAGTMAPGNDYLVGEKMIHQPVEMDSYMNIRLPPSGAGELSRRWYKHWLKGEDTGLLNEAPITMFVQGENIWRDEQEWPLARTQYTAFYLDCENAANSVSGDGVLKFEAPSANQSADQFDYDPANPVPSKGGTFLNMGIPPGIFEQADVEKRRDVLVYSTSILEDDLEVTGPVKLKLWIATSVVDTDFTARLTDVDKYGKSWGVCDGVARLRFRKEKPGLVIPYEVQEVEIELSPTSYLFKVGHKLRLQVSSSNYPLFEMNSNTGKSLFLDAQNEMVVAQQTVYHDVARPSHLMLPIIPRR